LLPRIELEIAVQDVQVRVLEWKGIPHDRCWACSNSQKGIAVLHLVAVPPAWLWCALVIGNTKRVARHNSCVAVIEEVVFTKLRRIHVQPGCEGLEALRLVRHRAPELVVVRGIAGRDWQWQRRYWLALRQRAGVAVYANVIWFAAKVTSELTARKLVPADHAVVVITAVSWDLARWPWCCGRSGASEYEEACTKQKHSKNGAKVCSF
jgi:hypothetical protein